MASSGLLSAYQSRDRMAGLFDEDGEPREVRLAAGRILEVWAIGGSKALYQQTLNVPAEWIPKDITAEVIDGRLVVVFGGFISGSSDGAQNAYAVTDYLVGKDTEPATGPKAAYPGAINPDGSVQLGDYNFGGRAKRVERVMVWARNSVTSPASPEGELWVGSWDNGKQTPWIRIGPEHE